MLRSRSRLLAGLASTALLLAACTSGSSPASSPSPSTSVVTSVDTAAPTPVSSGPTNAARSSSCPLVTQAFVKSTIGMRLGRITVLRSGGEVVGCRFYAYQGGALHASEHLPGPNQPAVEITAQSYASSLAAHNAFVRRAGTSSSVTQVAFGGTTGLCFQDDFDPQDKGADYACTVNKGPTMVLVRTVDTTQTTGAAAVLTTALHSVAQ